MLALARTSIPFIETLNGETFVGHKVKLAIELLLLLGHASPGRLTRKAPGISAKCSQPTVTRNLRSLASDLFVHQSASGNYYITSSGEIHLANQLQTTDTFAERC